MSIPVLLGIDLGTSATKVCAVDANGNEVAHGACAYQPAEEGPAPAEADTHTWWKGVREATGQALRAGNLAVQAVGLSGQMHGVVAVDAEGSCVRRPIIWSDTRAMPCIPHLARIEIPFRASILNKLGPGFAAAILYWLSQAEPTTLAMARWALQPKDWLGLRLTGGIATDASDASATGLWDFQHAAWHREFCDAMPIDYRLLPPVLGGDQVRGGLREEAALDLGLCAGIPVVLGRADTVASHLGSNSSLAPGHVILTLGTGGQLCQLLAPASAQPAEPPEGVMYLVGPGDHDHYIMAPTYSAGMSLDWARRLWSLSWEQLFTTAFSVPATVDGPLFTPFAPGQGPAPVAAAPTASWHDVRPGNHQGDLLRAALEGCIYALRMAKERLLEHRQAWPFTSCTLVGGSARDDRVKQLVADVLGISIRSPEFHNASARGAALSAGVAAGWFSSARAASQHLARPLSTIEPDPMAQIVHSRRFERFSAIIGGPHGGAW